MMKFKWLNIKGTGISLLIMLFSSTSISLNPCKEIRKKVWFQVQATTSFYFVDFILVIGLLFSP
jgi:hypothetical protein